MVEKNPLIKKAKCGCCGGVVDIRADKHGKAYYNCPNSYDDGTKCKRSVRFSVRQSRSMKEQVQREQAAKSAPKGAVTDEPADKTEESHPYD